MSLTYHNKGILELGQTQQMYVVAEVYETDIKKVRLGQKAIITSALPYSNGEIHLGHVASTYLPADVTTRFLKQNDVEAYFVCALTMCWPDGYMETVEGYVHGKLTFPSKGNKGFGYDPIFIPNGQSLTYGEIEPEEKHQNSHRADAFKQLLTACFSKNWWQH